VFPGKLFSSPGNFMGRIFLWGGEVKQLRNTEEKDQTRTGKTIENPE
jgi:hypothetical protein